MTSLSQANEQFALRDHWKCLSAVFLVSISSFQYGLDFGIIGGLQAMVGFLKVFGEEAPDTPLGYNLSAVRQQLISSLMILGAFIASSTAGFTARFFGRKISLWLACVLVFVSTAMMQASTSIGALYAGRTIIGIGNGLLMTHAQLYIHETTPARYRGLAIGSFNIWTSVGSLVGTVIDNFTQKDHSKQAYILSLGLVHILPGVLCFGLFLIPESPRWLLSKGKEAEAEKALNWLRPRGFPVKEEFEQMQAGLEAERLINSNVGFMDVFRNPVDRRRTLLSIAAITSQAASGSMFMISYGTYFFAMAGIGDPFANSCILSSCGVVAIILNAIIITRYGRRRVFLMTGLVICGICQLIVACVYNAAPGTAQTGKVIVGISIIYIVSYNGGINTYAWVAGGEFPSQQLRSYTFGLATAVGFAGAWLTSFTAPYFINPDALNWGPKYGFIWMPSCLFTAIWMYFYFPETMNRTLEEIDELFEAKVPARKFRKYQCTGPLARVHDEKVSSGDEKVRVEEEVESTSA
ncbi:general substrate transporter [Phialemonium atrogriseum]|uniref:General substrate transporter n=1 Tax=Phialemonium atrogriseum TaxID=1093897 RepID=A0AAJ0FAR0_9PEZI|nr:general substrate transporter [Phialemonium atrogriseum]KAK1761651.1 general substrate transporter [Phialemonium atrogriseum]